MIAMQLTSSDFLNPPAPRAATPIAPDNQPSASNRLASISTPFQPLDPGIVDASIPAFFIGRNKEGFWLARDVKGQIGGIFLFQSSALAFARRNSWPLGCATIFPSGRFELDAENHGNPLIPYLWPLLRLAMGGRRRMAAPTGKIFEAIERRLKFFNFF
jgi:hypothetical protein